MIKTLVYLILMIAVLVYPPATLSLECYKSCMRRQKLNLFETIKCWIPIYNLTVIRNSFYGSAHMHQFFNIIILFGVAFRAFVIFALPYNQLALILSVVAVLISMTATWILAAVTFIDTGVCVRESFTVLVLCAVTPPLGAYLVSRKVRPYMKSVKDELEGTFKG